MKYRGPKDNFLKALLTELEVDREAVKETSIDELEAEIEKTVFDLFDLTEDGVRL